MLHASTLLESWAQPPIVVSMEVCQEPVLSLWSCLIRLAAKLVHHEVGAGHHLPVGQS